VADRVPVFLSFSVFSAATRRAKTARKKGVEEC
jgi:hypothetical protein